MKTASSLNYELLAALLLTTVAGAYELSGLFLPIHDTFLIFEHFNFYYTALFYENRPPLWAPYGFFGLPYSATPPCALTAASYLTILSGKLGQIRDSLLLFRASIFLEQLFFITGLCLLSQKLLASLPARCLVVGTAALNIIWVRQIHFNFRIYYLLPLVLYLLLRFFHEKRGFWFWLAGSVCVLALYGNAPYTPPLWILTLTCFCLPFWREWRQVGRALLRPGRADVAALLLFVFMAAGWMAALSVPMSEVTDTAFGRDPVTHLVSPQDFVSHYSLVNAVEPLRAYLGDCQAYIYDMSIYIGLLPLGLAIWAAFRVSRIELTCCLLPAAILLPFSLGGVWALVFYYFPTMPLYRHVSHVYAIVGLFLLLASGFGLEEFMRQGRRRELLAMPLLLLVAADAFFSPYARSLMEHGLGGLCAESARLVFTGKLWNDPKLALKMTIYYRIFIYALVAVAAAAGCFWRRNSESWTPPAWLPVALLAALALDLGSFRYVVGLQPYPSAAPQTYSSLYARPFRYWPERETNFTAQKLQALPAPEQNALSLVFSQLRVGMMYEEVCLLTHIDMALSKFRANLYPPRVLRLLALRGVAPSIWEAPDKFAEALKKPGFAKALGCDSPKLRFVTNPRLVYSAAEAEKLAATADDLDTRPVLQLPEGNFSLPAAGTETPPAPAEIPLKVTGFSTGSLKVALDVPAGRPGWLIYADSYSPRWQATIDGRPTPIAIANLAFKAVPLGAGHHEVEFVFRHPLQSTLNWAVLAINLAGGLILLSLMAHALIVNSAGPLSWRSLAITTIVTAIVLGGICMQTFGNPGPQPLESSSDQSSESAARP